MKIKHRSDLEINQTASLPFHPTLLINNTIMQTFADKNQYSYWHQIFEVI